MPKKAINTNSNALGDLATHLARLKRRGDTPNLGRSSYLLIDKKVEDALTRLRENHPDYYSYRVKNLADPLPSPDSCARHTGKPRGAAPHDSYHKRKLSRRGFSPRVAKFAFAPEKSHRINGAGNITSTTVIPVGIYKALAVDASVRNISISSLIAQLLSEKYGSAALIIENKTNPNS